MPNRQPPRESARCVLAALLCLALGACGVGGKDGAVDGSVVLEDGGTEPLLYVGTGTQSFESLEDGDVVTIIAGPQGGHHVWTAVRVRPPVDPRELKVQVRLEQDGTPLVPTEYQVNLVKRSTWHEYYGLLALVPDPDAVRGQTVTLAVDVEDRAGITATASRTVIPQGP